MRTTPVKGMYDKPPANMIKTRKTRDRVFQLRVSQEWLGLVQSKWGRGAANEIRLLVNAEIGFVEGDETKSRRLLGFEWQVLMQFMACAAALRAIDDVVRSAAVEDLPFFRADIRTATGEIRSVLAQLHDDFVARKRA